MQKIMGPFSREERNELCFTYLAPNACCILSNLHISLDERTRGGRRGRRGGGSDKVRTSGTENNRQAKKLAKKRGSCAADANSTSTMSN